MLQPIVATPSYTKITTGLARPKFEVKIIAEFSYQWAVISE